LATAWLRGYNAPSVKKGLARVLPGLDVFDGIGLQRSFKRKGGYRVTGALSFSN
jgi:hypothetical protein